MPPINKNTEDALLKKITIEYRCLTWNNLLYCNLLTIYSNVLSVYRQCGRNMYCGLTSTTIRCSYRKSLFYHEYFTLLFLVLLKN